MATTTKLRRRYGHRLRGLLFVEVRSVGVFWRGSWWLMSTRVTPGNLLRLASRLASRVGRTLERAHLEEQRSAADRP